MAGLIAFNLILERVSLLDGLKKDVTALAQVHANHAEREISEYDSLLKALADRARHGDGFGDLVAQRQSFDPALVEARLLASPGTGTASRGISGLFDGHPARHPTGKQDLVRPPASPRLTPPRPARAAAW